MEEDLRSNSQAKEAPQIVSVIKAGNIHQLYVEPLPKNLLPRSLEKNYIETIPEQQVIFDGMLYKYKPNFNRCRPQVFMARWCTITREDFCFYAKAEPYAPLSSYPIKRVQLS